jgi:hypothetical protein
MATPEITLRGEVRDAVIGCVVRDIESSLDAVQAEYGTALQTFDCLDLLNARAQAGCLANAIELLARLIDPDRVDQEIEREREFAKVQQGREALPDEEIGGAGSASGADHKRASSWMRRLDSQNTRSNWIGGAVRLPDFLESPKRNGV